jgi:hypothetical protein
MHVGRWPEHLISGTSQQGEAGRYGHGVGPTSSTALGTLGAGRQHRPNGTRGVTHCLVHYLAANPRGSCGRRHVVAMAGDSWYGHLCISRAGALGRVTVVGHSLGRQSVLVREMEHVRRGRGRPRRETAEGDRGGRQSSVGREGRPCQSSRCVVMMERGSIPVRGLQALAIYNYHGCSLRDEKDAH